MIDSVEPLSCVLWAVAFFAAGMYPLGFMMGAPCSPCCDSNAGCTPLFHRCLRELSVAGSSPALALRVPSLEIFTHAEAALKRASETAIVSVTVTVPSLAAVHLAEGEELVYQVSVGLSALISQGTFSAPANNPAAVVTITLVGRTLNPNDSAYRQQAPPIVSGSTATIYASPVSQTVTLSEIEIDLANTTQAGCTLQTCGAGPTSAGVTRVSGRERATNAAFYKPTVTASIASLLLDKWIVDGTVMRDGFLLRELDFDRAEQFLNGEIALTKQRQYSRYDPTTRTFIAVTDSVNVQLAEYSPLCEMALCQAAVIQTKILDELLPAGVTYTPAANEKYGCKDAYQFVLGNPNGGCTYSHTTNECNGVVSKSVSLLEFWKQYSLDPVITGRSTSGGFSYYSGPDILTWMDYESEPLIKSGATYTIGGEYDSAIGRYGKCLSGGVAYLSDIDGTCHPAEISVDVGTFASVSFRDGTFPTPIDPPGGAADFAFIKSRLDQFSGTHVLSPGAQQACTGLSYGIESFGAEVTDVSEYGFPRTRRDNLILLMDYNTNIFSVPPNSCDRLQYLDYVTVAGGIHVNRQTLSGFSLIIANDRLDIRSSVSTTGVVNGNVFGSDAQFELYSRVRGAQLNQPAFFFLLTSSVSKSNGPPMPSCDDVTYEPTEFTIDNTSQSDLRVLGSQWLWGDVPGSATLNVTTSPAGNFQLCGGAPTTFGPFYNDRAQDRVYTRYAYSDGSTPTAITVTVKGTCIAYPHGLFELKTYFGGGQAFGFVQWYRVAYYGLYFGFPTTDYESGGCVMLPIKTNGDECSWTVTSNNDWLTLGEGTGTGTGDGKVNVLFASMPQYTYEREGSLSLSCNDRTATIRVRQGGTRFG